MSPLQCSPTVFRLCLFRLLPYALCLGAFFPALALDTLVRHNYDKEGRSFIKVDSVFGLGMKNGYLPYRVTIRNNTGENRTWTVRFTEDNNYRSIGYHTNFQFEVENGSEIITEVVVPIPPTFANGSGYRRINVTTTSPGLKTAQNSGNEQSDNTDWPTIALSSKLAQRSLLKLGAARTKKKGGARSSSSARKKFGYEYDPTALPSDWRGYTCLDVLMIDDTAWKNLSTSQRQAITEWIRLGGRCDIFSGDEELTLKKIGLDQLSSTEDGARITDLSLGKIHIQTWNDRELEDTVIKLYGSINSRNKQIKNDFGKQWQLFKEFGTKSFNPLLVFILLVVFAIIVAPVNLFYFARAGKRHKLFITTPIISLAACLVIIAIIFLQDGLGGSGRRIALADLQSHPDEMRLYISQEQVSRTGVMLKTGFTQKEPISITPVKLPDSSWNPLSRSSGSLGSLEFSGGTHGGDFFRSRTEQAYSVKNVQSTRSRIELQAQGSDASPPRLSSNLGFSVKDFLYYDHQGKVWKSPEGSQIDPGTIIPLEALDATKLTEWIREVSQPFSASQQGKIRSLARKKGRFVAIATDPSKLLIPTSNAIHWIDDFLVLTGSISLTEKPNPGTSAEQ